MSDPFMLVAIASFFVAAAIDSPYPQPPSPVAKTWGNFCCSVGWFCLTVGLYLRGGK